nr:hypothetical protein [Glaciimonas soli]
MRQSDPPPSWHAFVAAFSASARPTRDAVPVDLLLTASAAQVFAYEIWSTQFCPPLAMQSLVAALSALAWLFCPVDVPRTA